MTLWRASDAAAATGGKTSGDWAASGVSIDTRSLAPGDLFVALKDQRDGHDFVAQALEKGAAAALVAYRPGDVAEDAPLLIVPDVLAALWDMARFARARMGGKVVAITGSVGKTGTKEMLRLALSAEGRTHAAEKSYNNHWGVPLTLARMPEDTEFAVIEIGMNAPGEIAPLARLARPHLGLITTVAPVHIAAFENVEGIAREKGALAEGIEPGGQLVINGDIPTRGILEEAAGDLALLHFGTSPAAEARLLSVATRAEGVVAEAEIGDRRFAFRLGAPGAHLAMNALGALASVDALGGDLARAILALASWVPPEGRGERWRVALGPGGLDGEITLIDESFNANPLAMGAAFDVLAASDVSRPGATGRPGRRVAFLGDMLELGRDGVRMHADLAAHRAMDKIDIVHTSGSLMGALHSALPDSIAGDWAPDAADMATRVARLVTAGDVVLVKGSKGSKLGPVVEAIKDLGAATRLHG